MLVQVLIVALIVVLCAASAIWNLMPAAARRACVRAALRLPWPVPVATRLQQAATETSGCGGCKHAPAKQGTPSIHVVRKSASTKRS